MHVRQQQITIHESVILGIQQFSGNTTDIARTCLVLYARHRTASYG